MRKLFRERKVLALYLVVADLAMYFGFRVWMALFNDFAVGEIGVGPAEIGGIQAIREVPGLLGSCGVPGPLPRREVAHGGERLVNALINTYWIGRPIARWGERTVLSVGFVLLIPVSTRFSPWTT